MSHSLVTLEDAGFLGQRRFLITWAPTFYSFRWWQH